jgi:hypothetical protein
MPGSVWARNAGHMDRPFPTYIVGTLRSHGHEFYQVLTKTSRVHGGTCGWRCQCRWSILVARPGLGAAEIPWYPGTFFDAGRGRSILPRARQGVERPGRKQDRGSIIPKALRVWSRAFAGKNVPTVFRGPAGPQLDDDGASGSHPARSVVSGCWPRLVASGPGGHHVSGKNARESTCSGNFRACGAARRTRAAICSARGLGYHVRGFGRQPPDRGPAA